MYVKSFRELTFWAKSMDLAKEIYRLTDSFPKQETYGLSSQMRRSAVSIPSNIAEGKQRNNLREYIQFLYISYGSSAELETQMLLAIEIYGNKEQYVKAFEMLHEVQRILNAVIGKLKAKS
jgi:four helix bundle protein